MTPGLSAGPQQGVRDRAARAARKPVPVPTAARWRSVPVHPWLYALVGLALFLGTVQGAKLAGIWSTSGRFTSTGQQVQATGADPSEIKGWMTVQQLLDAYQIPRAEFDARFGVPADFPATTQLRDLENVSSRFSVSEVRSWLKSRLGVNEGSSGEVPPPS